MISCLCGLYCVVDTCSLLLSAGRAGGRHDCHVQCRPHCHPMHLRLRLRNGICSHHPPLPLPGEERRGEESQQKKNQANDERVHVLFFFFFFFTVAGTVIKACRHTVQLQRLVLQPLSGCQQHFHGKNITLLKIKPPCDY